MKNIEFQEMKIDELMPADYNPRLDLQPGDPDYENLKKSIEQFGFVQNVVFNKKTGRIVGGHQRIKVLKDLGYTELMVAVVDIDNDLEKALNIGLNKIEGSWDMPKLQDLLIELQDSDIDLDLTGFNEAEMEDILMWEVPEFEDDNNDDDSEKYTTKIDIPQYQITGEKPELHEIVNTKKTDELLEEIENSNLTEEEKEFLKQASTRHLTFNYRKIAEYYAHASEEVQQLMEKSALVIIDYNDAIKNGFSSLSEQIKEMWEEDYGEE